MVNKYLEKRFSENRSVRKEVIIPQPACDEALNRVYSSLMQRTDSSDKGRYFGYYFIFAGIDNKTVPKYGVISLEETKSMVGVLVEKGLAEKVSIGLVGQKNLIFGFRAVKKGKGPKH